MAREGKASALQGAAHYGTKRMSDIYENLTTNNLWKRVLKNVIATTAAVSICLIPGAKTTIGKAAYLAAITTVFGHPGRRFGLMVEALTLALCGTLLGVAWSILAIYLSSLVFQSHSPAAYAIRGFFLAIAMMVHGFLRSRTPRLFIFVLLLIIVSVVSLISTATSVTPVLATQILYPILLAMVVSVLVNLCIFPEFSSSFLGQMTIETLNDTANALKDAGRYFIHVESSMESNLLEISSASEKVKNASANLETVSHSKGSNTRKLSMGPGSVTKDPSETNKPNGEKAKTSISLSSLTMAKTKLRTKLLSCRAAQRECNFEVAVSVLPPRNMKSISVSSMKKLVANTVALIGACESKYALLGDSDKDTGDGSDTINLEGTPGEDPANVETENSPGKEKKQQKENLLIDNEKAELEMIKPRREIEFGDAQLLQHLLKMVADPYRNLHTVIDRTVDVVSACIAYTYGVPKLPSGARVPTGIIIEELDLHISHLQQALLVFDSETASALENAVLMQETIDHEPDIMPREEIFLISSFLLNLRQAASHLEDMLKHSRQLVLQREQRHGRRRIYAPRISWVTWLYSGGGEDEALPASGSKANRQGASNEDADDEGDADAANSKENLLATQKNGDLEKTAGLDDGTTSLEKKATASPGNEPAKKHYIRQEPTSRWLRFRGQLADSLEWLQDSDDVLYAVKITIAVFLVVWPALISSWNTWYSLNRGLWAALQLVLITEVSIGNSIMTFIIRGIGTTLGCVWGWAAWEAGSGNPIVCAAMICIGVIPSAYVQLGTKYPKAGMVSIISMCVVALSTELKTVPGTATENFLKRWIAFMIGGAVALVVEVVILPVKARTRLVESLAAALRQISEMESCVASGIEKGVNINVYAPDVFLRFEQASGKANGALCAAETFLPFCSNEPRIKGSFKGLALIYEEILFVLHQIVDRMDNMFQLRTAYGSGPLEDFNAQIYPYRRNVAGSITLTLFAVHSALTTKLALPQFLPSARLAHLRMINRVREVVQKTSTGSGQEVPETSNKLAHQHAVRRKYMSWNAASAAQAEIIEFLEELIDLTKLLVGANEFRSGLLTRPTYRDYVDMIGRREDDVNENEITRNNNDPEATDESQERPPNANVNAPGLTRRRRGTTLSASTEGQGEDIPASLRRIQSRKVEAGIQRRRTNDSWNQHSH